MAASAEDLALFGAEPEPKPKSAEVAPATPDDVAMFSGPSTWDKVKGAASTAGRFVGDSFSRLGHTVATAVPAAIDLASPISKTGGLQVPFGQLIDPSYRREAERGVSDVVTGGAAEKLGNLADQIRDKHDPNRVLGPILPGTAADDANQAPGARSAGNLIGMGLPSPFNYLGGQAAKLVPGTGPLAAAGRGVAAYEGMAVPQAATQAALNAPEGHRLEAAALGAADAATDPAGLALAGGIPAATEGVKALANSETSAAAKAKVIKGARDRATKDMANDIVAAEGSRARVTDQKRIAEVSDRLFDLTKNTPGLRDVWRQPATEALPKLNKIMRDVIEPKDGIYKELDAATVAGVRGAEDTSGPRPYAVGTPPREGVPVHVDEPGTVPIPRQTMAETVGMAPNDNAGPAADIPRRSVVQGGIRLRDVVDGYRNAAKDAIDPSKGGGTFGEQDAARLNGRADQMLRVYGKEAPPRFNPDKVINEDGMKAGEMIKILERRPNAPGVADEIARIKATASEPGQVDLDARIPTLQFRKEVTESAKAAEVAMGGLEGTAKHEALDKLYRVGGDILNEHIDSSGLPPERAAQLRRINDEYFLLKRAQTAIEARGWKEANRPGFHLPHGVKAAVEGGSLAGMAGFAALHPHALLPMAATYGLVKGGPAVASRVNWKLANMDAGAPVISGTANPAAIARVIQAARAPGASRASIQAQADKDKLPPEIAANIAQQRGL